MATYLANGTLRETVKESEQVQHNRYVECTTTKKQPRKKLTVMTIIITTLIKVW